MELVLASTSPYRRELLSRLKLTFSVAAPELDESPFPGETPEQTAYRLAIAKAKAVAAQHPDALIIGSDQVATLEGSQIGKPHTHENATRQLRAMRGKTVAFHTALCLYNSRNGNTQARVVPFLVSFRNLSDDEIERYLAKEQPYNCAGSAKSEGLGIALIEKMSGDDPNALIGLPLIALVEMLKNEGVFGLLSGTLYLIPTPLGEEGDLNAILPEEVRNIALSLDTFVAENAKTARHVLKHYGIAKPLQEIAIATLDEHTPPEKIKELLAPLLAGKDVGLMSEAGCPAVADPGAQLVQLAHEKDIKVVPLVGPSSLLLALMGSGMNGQSFAFLGYLPANREARVKKLAEIEKESRARRQTQLFIETPYRNQQMLEDIFIACRPETRLCVATDITQPSESIVTRPVSAWKKQPPEIHKKPTIFLLYAG